MENKNMQDNILSLLTELHQKTKTVQDKALKPLGLSLREYQIIELLFQIGQPVHQQVIAQNLGIDKALITRYLSALEKKEFIKRTCNPDNRREKNVILCEKAEKIIPKLKDQHQQSVKKIFITFSDDDLISFKNSLNKIIKNINHETE